MIKRYIEFNKKSDKLKPQDFRIAKYNEFYYKQKEYEMLSKALKGKENILIIGKPKAGKTRTAFELIKAKKNFKVLKLLEKPIEIQEIPDQIFTEKIIVFLDDLNKFVGNLDISELIKKLGEKSEEFIIVATCRSGKEFEAAEKGFADNIEEFNFITIKDVSKDVAVSISKSEDLQIKEFDGTIGSLFLGIKAMQLRYNALPGECKFLFQTLNLLHDSRIYIPNKNKLKKN